MPLDIRPGNPFLLPTKSRWLQWAVVLGLAATTAVAEATSLYLRYEGEVSGQDNAHAFTAGFRMKW